MFKYDFSDAIYTEKNNGVTRFRIEPQNLEKWLHQNKADYLGDYFDGVLLDNFTVMTKKGYAAIYENFVNTNQSDYLVEFASFKNSDRIFNKWNKVIDDYLDMINE